MPERGEGSTAGLGGRGYVSGWMEEGERAGVLFMSRWVGQSAIGLGV